MGTRRIPESKAILEPPRVPSVEGSPSEILRRPFTHHEAAFLVAAPDEWQDYLIVGREPGLFEILMPAPDVETRFSMRRRLENSFWQRIKSKVQTGEWRAVLAETDKEVTLGRFQIAAARSPFDVQLASDLSKQVCAMMVFEQVQRPLVKSERGQWEQEAVDHLIGWRVTQPSRIPVSAIDAEIDRKFPHYNFTDRAKKRIRKNAGLMQRRGPVPHVGQ